MNLPTPSPHAHHWTLDPAVVFLNHGSFGACPRAVLEAQSAVRARLEREPVKFFVEELEAEMDRARAALGRFLNAAPSDLAFLPNATTAVATVIENLARSLSPGDEILVNTHEYPACQNGIRAAAARHGLAVRGVPLPWPVASPDSIADAILAGVGPRTRVALVSHVTSPSGIVLPLRAIAGELSQRGVVVIADGAHGVGFHPIDLADLARAGVSYYASNAHKWLCAPKGSAVLWVHPERQAGFRPLVLSNRAEAPRQGRAHFLTEFDYQGTADPSAYLAIPSAIDAVAAIGGGWDRAMASNRALAIRGRATLMNALGTSPMAPESMLGSMACVALPPHEAARAEVLAKRPSRYHDALQDALLDRHGIQVPIWGVVGGPRTVRISAQLYNTPEQYEYLAAALREELARERRD